MAFERKSLTSAFTAAALGAGLLLTSCVSSPSSRPSRVEGSQDVLWNKILREDSPSYYTDKRAAESRSSRTIALQIEDSDTEASSLLLYKDDNPHSAARRHGEAAAAILNQTADKRAGYDIDVRYVENTRSIMDWVYDHNDAYAKALFYNADILSLSMIVLSSGDQEKAYSSGTIFTTEAVAEADLFWKTSNVIFIRSAGNEGDDKNNSLHRANATHDIRGDTILVVGESDKDTSGARYIEYHSSRAGVSVVADNPFQHGFSYPYIRDKEALRKRLDVLYNVSTDDGKISDIFKERLKENVCPEEAKFFMQPLRSCHPDFDSASFKGKEILLKDPEWQAQNADKVLEAYKEGLVNSVAALRRANNADRRNYITGRSGTSFSTPHVAGMTAALRDRYPQITPYSLVSAALLAAEPVKKVGREQGYGPVDYSNNGRNLPHNAYEAGFGYLGAEAYESTVAGFANLLQKNPGLSQKELNVQSQKTEFGCALVTEDNRLVYELTMDEDALALRTNLEILFEGGSTQAPLKITLVNPQGGSVDVSVTRVYSSGGASLSLASTDGHFGNPVKGVWKIITPHAAPILSARLSIAGMERQGLIDTYLQKTVDQKPYELLQYEKERRAAKNAAVSASPSP